MDCAEFKSFVHVYVDGEFAEHERGEADAHVASCAECRALARFEAEFKGAVREAAARSAPNAPATLRERIAEGLAGEPAPGRRFRWRWAYAPVPLAAGVASAALVVYAAAPRESSDLREVVGRHVMSLPMDYPCSSPLSCAEWARAKLGFNARLPVLGAGFMPMGVRVSNVRERPAAHVQYYAAPGRRASLLVFRDVGGGVSGRPREVGGRQVFLATEAGFNIAQWKRDEVVYSLVSDLDEQDILHLVSSAEER